VRECRGPRAQGTATISSLAARLGLDATTVTRQVAAMADARLAGHLADWSVADRGAFGELLGRFNDAMGPAPPGAS
jgi:hypothetical protein